MPKERYLPGKINYEKLFSLMNVKGIKKTNLRNDYKIHPTTIQKIVAGHGIHTRHARQSRQPVIPLSRALHSQKCKAFLLSKYRFVFRIMFSMCKLKRCKALIIQ